MKEYILRIQGEQADIEPIDSCDCKQLEAVTVAMIKSLNERLVRAEKKIKDLEARPVLEAEPLYPHWTVTYHTTADPDLVDKYSKFTCKI